MARALQAGKFSIECINPRDFSDDKHKKVDDYKEDIKANSNSSNEILDSTTFNNIER